MSDVIQTYEITEALADRIKREEARDKENARRIESVMDAVMANAPVLFEANLVVLFDGPFDKRSRGRITLLQDFISNATGMFAVIQKMTPVKEAQPDKKKGESQKGGMEITFSVDLALEAASKEQKRLAELGSLLASEFGLENYGNWGISRVHLDSRKIFARRPPRTRVKSHGHRRMHA